jgi:hypothetical protein
MEYRPALLACDVFLEEIQSLLQEADMVSMPCVWLEMGLHDSPDLLRKRIGETIAEIERDPEISHILLAYGLCGNGLAGVRAVRCPLVIAQAHDCISILLGGVQQHEAVLKAEPGTYFYSPGWVRNRRVPGPDREAYLQELYGARYPDDPEMVEELIEVDTETFAHHNCAAYVDITNNKEAEDYCQGCARHLGWNYKRLQGDPSLLRNLLHGQWDSIHFLQVSPGSELGLDSNGRLCVKTTAR